MNHNVLLPMFRRCGTDRCSAKFSSIPPLWAMSIKICSFHACQRLDVPQQQLLSPFGCRWMLLARTQSRRRILGVSRRMSLTPRSAPKRWRCQHVSSLCATFPTRPWASCCNRLTSYRAHSTIYLVRALQRCEEELAIVGRVHPPWT